MNCRYPWGVNVDCTSRTPNRRATVSETPQPGALVGRKRAPIQEASNEILVGVTRNRLNRQSVLARPEQRGNIKLTHRIRPSQLIPVRKLGSIQPKFTARNHPTIQPNKDM